LNGENVREILRAKAALRMTAKDKGQKPYTARKLRRKTRPLKTEDRALAKALRKQQKAKALQNQQRSKGNPKPTERKGAGKPGGFPRKETQIERNDDGNAGAGNAAQRGGLRGRTA
jgi:hypothetical protein